MTAYVAGFLFDHERVALIRKSRPQWQAGRLNGIGGHIEPGETAHAAMVREFEEEAGARIEQWDHFATVDGEWGSVAFFRADVPDLLVTVTATTIDEGQIEIHDLVDFPRPDCLPNLSWLIPLARYRHDRYAPVRATEVLVSESLEPQP